MVFWLSHNISTIIIGAILIAVVALIILKLVKDKKSGKSTCSCGGGCSSCPNSCSCHSDHNN